MTKNYGTLANKIASLAKDVAEETMRDAVIEIHNNISNTSNSASVVDTSVSCDGTWHHSGFSRNNGVFTTISLDNGTIFYVDPMSKFYKGYIVKNDLKHMHSGEIHISVILITSVLQEEWKQKEQDGYFKDLRHKDLLTLR